MIQTLTRHAVVAKFVFTIILRALHEKATSIFLDWSFTFRAGLGEELNPFFALVVISIPICGPPGHDVARAGRMAFLIAGEASFKTTIRAIGKAYLGIHTDLEHVVTFFVATPSE